MPRMPRIVPRAALSLALCACASAPREIAAPPVPPVPAVPEDTVLALLDRRDYFRLRDLSSGLPDTPVGWLARVQTAAAFNDPARSNAIIREALARPLPDDERFELLELRAGNDLSLYRYADAYTAARRALEVRAAGDSAEADQLANLSRAFAALRDAPQQTVIRRGGVKLRLDGGGFDLAMLPLTVNDSVRSYVLDTGANFSTIMRSEALAVGMRIRPAGFRVGTSTDREVTADLAVADRLTIGDVEVRNAVFMVMDDEALTFPDSVRIPGIVGFPVIEALGELRLSGRRELEVPSAAPRRTARNLALEGQTPITPVSWLGERFVCELDTGADTSQFFYPFFRRFRTRIEAAARPDTARYAGAGGSQAYPGYRMPRMRLAVGDTTVAVDSVFIHSQPSADPDERDFPACRIGQDVLAAYERYVLNFRDMAFLLL